MDKNYPNGGVEMVKCTFCDRKAERIFNPPMCANHADIALLVAHLPEPTLDAVLAMHEQKASRLSITRIEVPYYFETFMKGYHEHPTV